MIDCMFRVEVETHTVLLGGYDYAIQTEVFKKRKTQQYTLYCTIQVGKIR
jgi:hypothetical protein